MVGYSAKPVGWAKAGQKFNIMVNQFRNVDGTEAKLYMKDIKPNQTWETWSYAGTGFQPGADSIQLFNENGQLAKTLSYACQEYMDEGMYEGQNKPGWYLADDVSNYVFDNPLDNEFVPYGNGYVIKAGSGDGVTPALTFSGEVKQSQTDVPGAVFSFSGNCTPVGFTVGDIKCNQTWETWSYAGTGFQPGSDSIQFYTEEGRLGETLSYACQEYMDEGMYEGMNKPGWYLADDVANYTFDTPKGSVEVPAGSGFVFKTGSGDGVWPIITIPSPIKKGQE